ncbi:MAG: DinB family protein, partial [Gemmatimonadaceae bacterium]|nr:DinB family protein [Gemmatimonadaceae bacterium]
MHQVPWFERVFAFDRPLADAPALIERVRGTSARLAARVATLPASVRTGSADGTWSIQQHVGHLGDLEPLWLRRVEDLLAGRDTLSPTDLANSASHEANHNAQSIDVLLARFRDARAALVDRLERCADSDWLRSARHPRLGTQMRLL